MEGGGVFLHGGIAVDVEIHGLVISALHAEESGAGGDGDDAGSIVLEGEPFVVDGVEMVDADDVVVGDERPSGFAVIDEDGDGFGLLRGRAGP